MQPKPVSRGEKHAPDTENKPEPVPAAAAAPAVDAVMPKVDPKAVALTDEEKIDFYKAFIADRCWTREYSLFDGGWKVVLKVPTVRDENDALRQLEYDRQHNRYRTNQGALVNLVSYKLAQALESINGAPVFDAVEFPKAADVVDKGETYLLKRKAWLDDNWSSTKLGAMLAILDDFSSRADQLAKATLQKDFWQAVR